MGFTYILIMEYILLVALIGLLHAEVVVKHLRIHEGEVDYTQTVTFDYDRNIQILEVPAHNSIVHSKTIFDFNQGVLFESHPERNTCYMKDIPEGVVSMDSFAAFLDKKTDTIIASQQKTTRRAYKTTKKITPTNYPQWPLKLLLSVLDPQCSKSSLQAQKNFQFHTAELLKVLQMHFLLGKKNATWKEIVCGKPVRLVVIPAGGLLTVELTNITAMRPLSITVLYTNVLDLPIMSAKCPATLVSISSVQVARVPGITDANLDLKVRISKPVQLILHLGKIAVFCSVVSLMI